jgi:hypothetical protein
LDARRPHFAVAQHYVAMQSVKLILAEEPEEVFLLISQVSAELGMERVTVEVLDPALAGGRRHWAWIRLVEAGQPPVPAKGQALGPSDRHQMEHARGLASWDYEKAEGSEQELEMDRRVLMAEFMRQAMERLCAMAAGIPVVRHTAERMELGLSVNGLKGRLYVLKADDAA